MRDVTCARCGLSHERCTSTRRALLLFRPTHATRHARQGARRAGRCGVRTPEPARPRAAGATRKRSS
eukprot:2485809-Prymnesium_polylepis.1